MATLPDGDTVALEVSEGFETIGVTYPTLRTDEGWEDPIFVMGGFSITVDSTTVEAGGSITVDGSATDEAGNAEPAAPYTVKALLDGTEKARADGTTAGDGSFTETLQLEDPGEHVVFAENDAAGKQWTEGFGSIGVNFPTLRVSEGFEDA